MSGNTASGNDEKRQETPAGTSSQKGRFTDVFSRFSESTAPLRRGLGDVTSTAVRRQQQTLAKLPVIGRGYRFREQLREVPIHISVSGTRGKSTMTRWLYRVLRDREYDAYGKITGVEPTSLYDGESHRIPRDGQTTLYENVSELRRYEPADAIVLENQAITPYTTRLFHTRFVEPSLIVVTNVRRDHLDTLGRTRGEIARSITNSFPDGVDVLCCEQNESVRAAIDRSLQWRDVSVTYVDPPKAHQSVPGSEMVYGVDAVLEHIGEPPLSEAVRESLLEELRVEWTELPGGRLYNAASVNDIDSTELIRQALAGEDPVVPFVFLRRDRPARTRSFEAYLEDLNERDLIHGAVVGGTRSNVSAFAADVSVPVDTVHCEQEPESVLDELLDIGPPVLLMGNTVHPFMKRLDEVIEQRALRASQT